MFGRVTHAGYRSQDFVDIHRAKTFSDLAVIALRIMDHLPQPLGLISAPITTGGFKHREANLVIFQANIEALKVLGISLFDQMPMEERIMRIINSPYYKDEDQLLEEFYGVVLDSGLIKRLYSFPGAMTSYGAQWEHRRAIANGIEILSVPRDFKELVP